MGLRHRPTGGVYTAPPYLLAVFRGLISKGMGGEGQEIKDRGGKRRGGEGRE